MSEEQENREPDPGVIEVLQDHLNDALAGDVQAVAILSIGADGECSKAWAGADGAPLGALFDELPGLIHDVMSHMDAEPWPEEGE